MKKTLIIFLTVIMLFTLSACGGSKQSAGNNASPTPTVTAPTATPTATPTAAPTSVAADAGYKPSKTNVTDADKKANFVDAVKGDKEQGPVWFYLGDDGSGYKELYYTKEWGDNWQYSEAPKADGVYYSICDWEGFKIEAGMWGKKNIKIAIAWRAYKDGTAKIGPWDYTCLDGQKGLKEKLAGINVQILKGKEEIFSAATTVDGENKFAGKEVPVKTGDIIFFVVDGKNAPINPDGPVANVKIDTLKVELN